MALILCIDTSTELATVAVAENGICLAVLTNAEQKNHATWIHKAIRDCCLLAGIIVSDLQAVGITAGPGSYTGLRVGMATAKGLCYALNIPLIAVNTLLALAQSATNYEADLLCPLMDAGRMEVYTAVYTKGLVEVIPPQAMILDEQSFSDLLSQKTVIFFGSGKNKFQEIKKNSNAFFDDIVFNVSDLSLLIYTKFIQSDFASLAYTEPLYLKEYRLIIN